MPNGTGINITDIIMVVLTAVYVITTIIILKSQKEQFRERIRPKIYVDFGFRNAEMYVVIKNAGERAAHNINVQFSPDIKYKIGGAERSLNDLPLIKNLTFLGPHDNLKSLIGAGFNVIPAQPCSMVMANITYSDEKGKYDYKEAHAFAWEAYSKILYVAEKNINDVVTQLTNINTSIKQIKQK